MVEDETGCKVQTLRTDRGGEYMSGTFKDFWEKKGIKHQRSMPYTPQHNGVAKKKNSSGSKGYRLYSPTTNTTNKIFKIRDVIFAETTAQPMVAFDVPHMQTHDVFEGLLPSFVENQESQQVDNIDQSFDQHVTPHDVEEIVREEQEVLREERTLPKWVQKTLQDSKLDAPLPRKTPAGPMLTRIAYQALDMIEDLPVASSQASLIQQAKYVPKAVRTTSSATSSKASKTTRSKKSSSEEERTETDKEQDSPESAQEEVPKEVGTSVPSVYESDEEDTSVPLERKSQRPRSQEQLLLDEAMARFQCQQVVAKESEIQKTRANQAQEEIANLSTALDLVTKERDSAAKENENLIRDLMDLQSQLTRKEAQNHELIKNDKKMKEQLKYEDARYQKLNASYNTVKSTLTALLQNQEPAAAEPSTSDSATLNTMAVLQAEIQTEKLQRQLLVSGFMSQTAQHEAKVKQLEE
ncbi:hypothetical protein L7F22_047293 [Adiantum nelumboides]|nr:hypothetical protein [Adiantum nelumboides]